jgi:hypothetical protein
MGTHRLTRLSLLRKKLGILSRGAPGFLKLTASKHASAARPGLKASSTLK